MAPQVVAIMKTVIKRRARMRRHAASASPRIPYELWSLGTPRRAPASQHGSRALRNRARRPGSNRHRNLTDGVSMTRFALIFLLLGSAIAIADPNPSSNETGDAAGGTGSGSG